MNRHPLLPRLLRRALPVVVAGALVASLSTATTTSYAAPAGTTDRASTDRASTEVAVYDYDLGDAAMTVPGFRGYDDKGMPTKGRAPIELTGRVYAPADAAGRHLPVAILAHGLFWTCANNTSGRTEANWPCRERFEGIHSDQGYDYLGRTLAARGMLVVSVGANGVNAGSLGEVADRARALVAFRHLRLWQKLTEQGSGRLVGAFRVAGTDTPATPDFTGAADFQRVGLMGHSRGGRGMMWAAARKNRHLVPEGVRLRAVFGFAPAEPPFMDRAFKRLQVTDVPLMTWAGSCDPTGDEAEFNRLARRADNPVNIAIMVRGANHNNLNTRWAASSGLPGGEDDAMHPKGRPGKCVSQLDGELHDTLGEDDERTVAATYLEAFFARYLQGDRSVDPVLAGTSKPDKDLTRVDVKRY
ncbi:hypothetical protein SAMN04489844_1912 [Nocardioides exalbidus]|uniref:Alpha/beta hydrolase family protein n=1 Tax=Nocardioides exalbidus TaxID=402596 RepID=A0A1H4QT69_9ACTN|nr:hypothetical protein [Nocardioides exalbidus]SEC22742.1 hypothetical protein SAMN04489844_1912 [Nocardioides exalbidus]